jgi:hypothetical protein
MHTCSILKLHTLYTAYMHADSTGRRRGTVREMRGINLEYERENMLRDHLQYTHKITSNARCATKEFEKVGGETAPIEIRRLNWFHNHTTPL